MAFCRDAGCYPMAHCGIELCDIIRLGLRLVAAASNNAGSVKVKLGKIGSGLPTLWIEFHSTLERSAYLFYQSGSREKSGSIRFLTVSAAQPEFVKAHMRIESFGALAGINGVVPVLQHEVGATEKIVRFGVVCRSADSVLQSLNCVVHSTGGEEFFRGGAERG